MNFVTESQEYRCNRLRETGLFPNLNTFSINDRIGT